MAAANRTTRAFVTRILMLSIALSVSSCTYLKYASIQAQYSRIQAASPEQLNVKHMIDRETFFVHGKSVDTSGLYAELPKAIAAFSSRYRANEQVDIMHFQATGSHFGLNLPEGEFDLLVFADSDNNGIFTSTEVIGTRRIDLNITSAPKKVLGQVDIDLRSAFTVDWEVSIDVPNIQDRSESVYFPSGTIRSLDDPIFDRSFSTMGMYDPASFMEQAPTMFYALEEDVTYKIPIVFVHGIAGSAREFETFVRQLDQSRYKPWFFHYPSGGDLEQLAELFYQIFLSGKVYRSGGMPIIIVAHSMGGLIAREAINQYRGDRGETETRLFVSIASPFGGHQAAATGEKYGLIVLPSWRDLNPESRFIQRLFRKPLPDFMHHELIYAFKNENAIRVGENSDGVVPLTSQLQSSAQQQADGQFGFNNTHTDSLKSPELLNHIVKQMDKVENRFSPAQLRLLRQGGYPVELGDDYSPKTRHAIWNYGKYLMALSVGLIKPVDDAGRRFVGMVEGNQPPRNEEEMGWLKFLTDHPEFQSGFQGLRSN